MAVYASHPAVKGPFAGAVPPTMSRPAAPAGTFLPGTKVHVGTHRVVIDRYLSEGGFAHVYVVTLPRPVDGNAKAVLKRVAVPDKEHLANMRTEVETMKRLRGQKFIVKYIDSHASQLKGGGYEVFLLMEFCQGGGLIDFMNTRLQNRLTEPEIIKIFTDVAEGVACMHHLKPPLLHRDLKVENVLISMSGNQRLFKLCDFGSAAPPTPAATSAAEARLIEDEIQRHTTLQYRSPEMIDVYRKLPIDEKSDIWALGVFLYKLCYYTTPFEEVGQMAILNAKFKYPGYPKFSDQMKLLIASMLREMPGDRPNIYQVLQKACQLDKRELPLRDIYAHRSQSESRKGQVLPQSPSSSQSRLGATLAPKAAESGPANDVPDIAPMRRGRPTKPVSHHGSAKPSPSPLRMIDQSSDPFASLDGRKAGTADELSSKFPTLDEFTLMTDEGKKFAFEPASERKSEAAEPQLAQRVTEALADQAFRRPASPAKPVVKEKPLQSAPKSQAVQTLVEKTRSLEQKQHPGSASTQALVSKPSNVVSAGTMTSPSPPPEPIKPASRRPIWKVPSHESTVRPASTGPIVSKTRAADGADKSGSRLARLLQEDAAQAQAAPEPEPRSPTSSRPSLEGARPLTKDLDLNLSRSKSLNIRTRPVTVNMGTRPTHIKDKEIKRSDYEANFVSAEPESMLDFAPESDMNITSDIDYLRAREEEEKERKGHHKRFSSGSRHGNKRSSLPHAATAAISGTISGTKNILTSRFGDAFKILEGNHEHSHEHGIRHSPTRDKGKPPTPVAASETPDPTIDHLELMETEELSPEMRRELEKRQLEAEERRVEQAASEYRQRTASRGGRGGRVGNRATNIQTKVQSLLQENDRPAQKTATGYGKYTTEAAHPASALEAGTSFAPVSKTASNQEKRSGVAYARAAVVSTSVDEEPSPQLPQKPTAPPKPKVLRTGQGSLPPSTPATNRPQHADPISPDDWEAKFNKRYPSLSGLEMVETDIEASKRPGVTKVREV